MSRRSFVGRLAFAAGFVAVDCALGRVAAADSAADEAPDYPSRPVRLIVAFPAGTAVDTLARLVAQRLTSALGVPVVVENHPGAAGNIGIALVARAPADGYTLAIAGAGVTINPSIHGKRAVDPVQALAAIGQLTVQPIVIVAHPSFHARSLADVIDRARAAPGRVAFSTPGIGTPTHIAAELLAQRTGISWLHVPYSGAGQLMSDVLSGDVPLAFTLLGAAEPFVRTGQLEILAVTTKQRSQAVPAVPTIAESGFAGFDIESWHGVVAPAGTPRPIVARLNFELSVIMRDPDIVKRLHAVGMEPALGTPHDFAKRIASETTRWRDVVERAGIRADR